jgi:hypothetical protein
MISASKTTFTPNNLKILRPEVSKNLTNLLKKFCEYVTKLHMGEERGSEIVPKKCHVLFEWPVMFLVVLYTNLLKANHYVGTQL